MVRGAATAVVAVVVSVLLAGPAAARPVTAVGPSTPPARPHVTGRVLAISVDGLNPRAIRVLGPRRAPTFHRLVRQGATTLNARSEYEQNLTLPDHTSMLTGRRIDATRGGHGVTWDDDRPGTTVQRAAGHSVASVFDVVHRAGRRTALFTTKEKFALYERSWPRSITRFTVDEHQRRLVRAARRDLRSSGRAFTFVHVSMPDRVGHRYGGMSKRYLAAVAGTDRALGSIIDTIARHPRLRRQVRVIVTADHGFAPGRTSHAARIPANYRVPFLVWGRGIAHADLYALNRDYRDPGRRRPSYGGRQPVRNGDLGNLALDLLGLGPIPGSRFDADQRLDVR